METTRLFILGSFLNSKLLRIFTRLEILSRGSLVGALISHFMFETVHPFHEGNGRVGCFLFSMCLSEPLSPAVALTLSSSINQNVLKCYKAFQTVEHLLNHSDCTSFVIFLLKTLLAGQQEFANLIEQHPCTVNQIGIYLF
ncbi:Fic family protein [Corynebacterium glutamicum]|uniref:Fic family protein n=1 Tax=Corynebacterium glutamicum TaxID=1718 RepID=UPI003B980745